MIAYPAFYDTCRKHGLRLRLCIFADPELEIPREHLYVPGAPKKALERATPKLTFRLEVRDGSVLCCAGDLGESIHAPEAPDALTRMATVLVGQGRARARDFPL